jgi:hypothetical protein
MNEMVSNPIPPIRNNETSPRKRAFFAIAVAFINFFGFLILTMNINGIFILPAILVPVGAGLYLLSLRCPNCGNRIYKRKVKLFGEEFTYWGGFIPTRCAHCEHEL